MTQQAHNRTDTAIERRVHELRAKGLDVRSIAGACGIGRSTVSRILRRDPPPPEEEGPNETPPEIFVTEEIMDAILEDDFV